MADRFKVVERNGRIYVWDSKTDSLIGFATTLERAKIKAARMNAVK